MCYDNAVGRLYRCAGAYHSLPKKRVKKNKQLVIRLSEEERDRFVSLCYDMDTSAAREIRKFIKRFIERNGQE